MIVDINEVIKELRSLNETVPKPLRLPTEDEKWKNFAEWAKKVWIDEG